MSSWKVKCKVFFPFFLNLARCCEARKKKSCRVLNQVTFFVAISYVIECNLYFTIFGDLGETYNFI